MENYILVFEAKIPELILEVNKQMEKGYIPQGGICVHHIAGSPYAFWQAMIKPPNTTE